MLAFLRDGYLYVTGVENTAEGERRVNGVVDMLRTMYLIGEKQIEFGLSGGLRAKKRTYELLAFIGHRHPSDGDQNMILENAKKTLGIEDTA